MFHAEDGPWDILARFRRLFGNNVFGKLLDCFYCLSIWISIPFAYFTGETWRERIFLLFALSGGAILLDRITSKSKSEQAIYYEDKESPDVMLWETEDTVPPVGNDVESQ
jgi:hypothetical protein